ncbi:MAG TPA: HAMP domain-containing protein [Anaerolineae bacterium]|nr:HAMP domain-containing protein [Anaerolineae bacterium]
MEIFIWGLQGAFSLGLPLRWSGYLFGSLSIIALIALIHQGSKEAPHGRARFQGYRLILLVALLLLAPVVSGILWLRVPAESSLVVPGLPIGTGGPIIAVLGALPWMLAAGLLGTWEAMAVGFVVGLMRGGFQTHSLLTPLHMTLQAGLVAWLLRREYKEWLGKAARSPFFSGLVGGTTYGLLRSIENFTYSGGSPFDGLDFALALFAPTLLASILETGIAGAIAEGVRWRWRKVWHQPRRFVAGPYQRSMAARHVTVFLLLGTIASLVVLEGDWLLAKASAEEMLADQMSQTAIQAGEAIPYFIQTGRSLVRSTADVLASFGELNAIEAADLTQSMRRAPFFSQLDVVNPEGLPIRSSQSESALDFYPSLTVEDALTIVLAGVPQEVVVPPADDEASVHMGFLYPIASATDAPASGVLAGWTALDSNPMLLPVVQSLSLISPGEAFVVDERGVILLHPDHARLMTWVDLTGGEAGEIFTNSAPDGTRQSVFVFEVSGYPWRVVVTAPQSVVNSLALRIAARLFLVLVVVGALLVLAVYFSIRRLTLPLSQMALAAEAIASGELSKPVAGSGDDEVGRLAASFERMRSSLKSRLEEMGLLLNVSQTLASSFELKQAIPPILAGIQALCDADFVRLLLLPAGDTAGGTLETFQEGSDTGNWASLDEQVISLCLQGGQFVLDNPSRASAVLEIASLTEAIETIMGMPIKGKEIFLGALWIAHRKPHAYTLAEIDLLSIIAGQLEASVTNARLYQIAEQERMRLGAVLQATPNAVVVTDGYGNISLANPAAESVLHGRAQDAVGKSVAECLKVTQLAEFLLQTGSEARTAEVQLEDGRVMFASRRDVRAGRDALLGRVCVLWDITHYKKLDMLKSEFVASVSHDLRTPLSMLHGHARMLGAAGSMNERQQELVNQILEGTERMTHLVDNLLDQSRVDAGYDLDLEPMRIEAIVEDAIEICKPQASTRQIEIHLTLQEDMRAIEADAVLLRQAIGNLVDNAIKYSHQDGQVRIVVSQEQNHQRIRIEDDGIGIAPSDLARIFERYYRGHPSERSQADGPGLGLSIAKSIAERHGGRIDVQSRLGEGSVFTLFIPMRTDESTSDNL